MIHLCFKEWVVLSEGIAYKTLIQMWKRFFPTEQDDAIKQHIDQIAEADPTPNKEYTNWLVREVLNKRVRLPEDAGILQPDIIFFHDLKRRNQLRRLNVEPNIDKYTRHQFQDAVEQLRERQAGQSKRQAQEEIKAKGAEKLYQDATWMVIKATTPEACVAYGKGSRWCTSGEHGNMAGTYLKSGPIFIIHKEGKPFAQLHTATNQFMDPRDAPLDPKQLPQDLKDILYRVIPKETDRDHLFLYKMTGKLDEKMQERAQATTQVIADDGPRKLVKSTSDIAAILNYAPDDQDDMSEEIKTAGAQRPVYALFFDGRNYYWTFNLDPDDYRYLGAVYKPSKGGHVRWDLGGYQTREEEERLPRELGQYANLHMKPDGPKEAICLFKLTGMTNSTSDQMLLKYLKDINMDDIKAQMKDWQSGEMSKTLMYNVYDYFAHHGTNHPELYGTVKDKMDELLVHSNAKKAEIERQHGEELKALDSPELDDKQRARIKRWIRKTRLKAISGEHDQGISTLSEIIGRAAARRPSPEVMQHMIDYAKQGWYWPIWYFWSDSLALAKKPTPHGEYDDYDDYDYGGDPKDDYNPLPWGTDGWPEGEPYIASWAARTGQGRYWGEKVRLYAMLTDNSKATQERMYRMFKEAEAEDNARREAERKEEEDYFNL